MPPAVGLDDWDDAGITYLTFLTDGASKIKKYIQKAFLNGAEPSHDKNFDTHADDYLASSLVEKTRQAI